MMSDGERWLRENLSRSAGTCNEPTDYAVHCFICKAIKGEIDSEIIRRVGGEWLANRINQQAKKEGYELTV